MATTNDDVDFWRDSDTDSIFSIITDDGEEHLPEKILAEYTRIGSLTWYLVKWKDSPLLRSSWENIQSVQIYTTVAPEILENWKEEKKRQAEGKTKPLNLEAFLQAVEDLENAQRERRKLRRFKNKINRILSAVNT